jgi:mRNA interferase YafQ
MSPACSLTCMRTIRRLNKFKRDYRRETKGRSREYVHTLDTELAAVAGILAADATLETRYLDHLLSGKWSDHRECHIRPDLLLIYFKPDQDTLSLVRLGSHSELFR